MSRDRKRLGRGLGAILGGGDDTQQSIRQVPIDKIRPNPHQPRRSFPEEALAELTESVRIHGIIQPLIVIEEIDGYTLVAGERRWRAARRAQLELVPVIVRQLDPMGMTELALIENLQREDLTPMEEAYAYQMLQEEFSLTQEAIAERVGKSRSQVANTLRLLSLDPQVQRDVHEGRISMGHAKLLLSVPSSEEQRQLAQQVIGNGWTVRELAGRLGGGQPKRRVPTASGSKKKNNMATDTSAQLHWRAAAESMQKALATRVEIIPNDGGRPGKIVLDFYSMEDFDRIYRFLTGEKA